MDEATLKAAFGLVAYGNLGLTQEHKDALAYLEHMNYVPSLTKICQEFKDSGKLTEDLDMLRFVIPICLVDLLEISAPVGNLVFQDFNSAQKIFKKAIFFLITENHLLESIKDHQVFAVLRVDSLPPFPECQIPKMQKTLRKGRLYQYQGIVTALSLPVIYTRSARYRCVNTLCGLHEFDVVKVNVSGSLEEEIVSSRFKCSNCSGILQENKSGRTQSEKIDFRMINQIDGQNHLRKKSKKSVRVCCKDELCSDVKLGYCYKIIGLIVYKEVNHGPYPIIEAINVVPVKDAGAPIYRCPFRDTSSAIQKIYEENNGSPWSFAMEMAKIFAARICPLGTFFRLKMSVLLSLLSLSSSQDKKSGISILAICRESLIVERILRYASKFYPFSISHTSTMNITAASVKDSNYPNSVFLEAGSLNLAPKRICVFENLNDLSKPHRDTLCSALGKGISVIDIGQSSKSPLSFKIEIPVEAVVWGSMEPRRNQDFYEMNETEKKYARLFNLVLILEADDYETNEEIAEILMHHTFFLAMSSEEEVKKKCSFVPDEEWEQFLNFSRSQPVEFKKEAEDLIKSYYVARRKAMAKSPRAMTLVSTSKRKPTEDVTEVAEFPVTVIPLLMTLSEAFAKLSLQTTVGVPHVLMTILLFEENLLTKTGFSPFDVKPLHHLTQNNAHLFEGSEHARIMQSLYSELSSFIASHPAGTKEE